MINDIKARLAAARDFIYDSFGSSMRQNVEYFSTRKAIRKLYGDCQSLLSEIERLKKYERGIGAPTRRLLDEIDRLTSENARLSAERDAAVADLKEASACTCGFCAHSEYNPIQGSYPGKTCPGNTNDCNGECKNWKWRRTQPKEG